MMNHDGSNQSSNLILQECVQSNALFLQGMEALHAAKLFTPLEGYFYTSFFNLSLSIERFLKIALICKYFYYEGKLPPSKFITDLKHNLVQAYNKFAIYSKTSTEPCILQLNEDHPCFVLFQFLSAFSDKKRYFNFDRILLSDKSLIGQPIMEWSKICKDTITHFRVDCNEKEFLSNISSIQCKDSIFHDIDGHKIPNADILLQQEITRLAKPYIITQIIETLKPITNILYRINLVSNTKFYEDNGQFALPHSFMNFTIFSNHDSIEKNKEWFRRPNNYLIL